MADLCQLLFIYEFKRLFYKMKRRLYLKNLLTRTYYYTNFQRYDQSSRLSTETREKKRLFLSSVPLKI